MKGREACCVCVTQWTSGIELVSWYLCIHHYSLMRVVDLLLRGTTWDVLVDLAIGKLVDLIIVLVTHAETVGGIIDFCSHSQ